MEPEVVMARDEDNGAYTALVFKQGRLNLHAVALYNPPVRLVKIPLSERRHLRPLMFKGGPYPVKRAVRQFRRAGKALGMTKGAKVVLESLRAEQPES